MGLRLRITNGGEPVGKINPDKENLAVGATGRPEPEYGAAGDGAVVCSGDPSGTGEDATV